MLLEGHEYSPRIQKWTKEREANNEKLKIAIFEGSDRIGGRVLSAKAPGLPDTVCELGGMRYVSSQRLVASLIENKLGYKLGKDMHQQEVTVANNIAHLRGQQLMQTDLSNPDVLPYNFSKEELAWLNENVTPKNSADNFLGYAVETLFPTIKDHMGSGLRDWLFEQVNPQTGDPLYKTGFWNLISPVLSNEAREIAITTVGYDCLGFNTNAVDTICELYDFVPGVKYYLLNDGFDSMLWNIQQKFENSGGLVIKNKWLESFDEMKLNDGSKGVSLKFKNEATPVSARSIVLAMPQRSINLLDRSGPVLNGKTEAGKKVQFMLNAVEPIHLYKMFIAYETAWWVKKKVEKGRSVTDIPIRQCYYWADEGAKKGSDNKNAILMVYNDARSSDFWGGLRHMSLGPGDTRTANLHKPFERKIMPYSETAKNQNPWDERLRKNWKRREAPHDMVYEMHRQLKILHGVEDAPEPFEAAFMDWGDDPYGGAVHFWNPGYKSVDIRDGLINPVKDFPCYICGEAYSTNQTWVEGAFQTAELVLKEFNFPSFPSWYSKKSKI
jgi:monoamine oxidase